MTPLCLPRSASYIEYPSSENDDCNKAALTQFKWPNHAAVDRWLAPYSLSPTKLMCFLCTNNINRIPNLDIPWAGRDGAAAGRRGWPGTGRTGRRWAGSPRRHPSILPPRRSKKTPLGVSLEERTVETLCKPTGDKTRGFSAVNLQGDSRSSFPVGDQCAIAPLSLRNLFMQSMSGKYPEQ